MSMPPGELAALAGRLSQLAGLQGKRDIQASACGSMRSGWLRG